jgi:threonine dehydrogenase-like Zn-dependent dehydrogenase
LKAVVYLDVGRVEVRDVEDPVIAEPTDAIVRVTTSAICGSDMHFFHGKAPLYEGETIGHEAVGVVEEVGSAVTTFTPGDRVVVSFDIACGACWFCRRGQTQLCEDFRNLGAGAFGGGLGGAQAELLRVPVADVNMLAVPEGIDDHHAVFVGDILTTGLYGATLGGVGPGDVVAVVGAGPVGYFCASSARALGATEVLVLERDTTRLGLARSAGSTPLDVGELNPQAAVDERTDGRGADVVIEAVGHPDAFVSAIDVVRRGGVVCIVGMYTGETLPIQLGVHWARALDLRFAGITPVHALWRDAMSHVANGSIDPLPVISHTLPLAEAAEGYALFDSRVATKVILEP